ncbi:MAG: Crp/Fnr family transcriptional regulator [Dehalococcoidales bacterium]|nr:Crp/Fnr family transcriptional regulator [Dehalococcoidales bacterium]
MSSIVLPFAPDSFVSKLPEPSRVELSNIALPRYLKEGDFLCRQGHVWPNAALLTSGKLSIMVLSTTGQEYTVHDIKPGEFFWGHSIFDDQPLPASVIAAEDSAVCLWSAEKILPMLFRNPEAMWEVFRLQVKFMRHANEIICGLAFQPVAARLARLLLNKFAEHDHMTIKRIMSLNTMASLVNTSPEVVCRILCRFQKDGILEVTRKSISLQDKQALKRITGAQQEQPV